jgi:hypothetical protein
MDTRCCQINIHADVPVDKAFNSIVFVWKPHYYECLINELRINDALGIPTYNILSFPMMKF